MKLEDTQNKQIKNQTICCHDHILDLVYLNPVIILIARCFVQTTL